MRERVGDIFRQIIGRKEARENTQSNSGLFSEPSEKHRDKHNEDRAYASDKDGLYAVFDGVGEAKKGGEAAAQTAKEFMEVHGADFFANAASLQEARGRAETLIEETNRKLIRTANRQSELGDVVTTVAMLKFFTDDSGRRYAIIANIGDSRVYLRRAGSSELKKISIDHLGPTIKDHLMTLSPMGRNRVLNALDEASCIADLAHLTPEELTVFKIAFRNRHLVGTFLGNEGAKCNLAIVEVNAGDEFLLTTDGVHDNTAKKIMGKRLLAQANLPADKSAKQIVKAAKRDSRTKPKRALPPGTAPETAAILESFMFTRQKKDDMTAVIARVPA